MFLERKQDLSVYYWLKDLFAAYPEVTIVDGYPEGDLALPMIAVEGGPLEIKDHELGTRKGIRFRIWDIEVFGLNKAMRDEFSSFILEDLETGIPVYDYDEGFPPLVSPTQTGLLRPEDIRVLPIRIFPELVEKMYWRNSITFYSEYKP